MNKTLKTSLLLFIIILSKTIIYAQTFEDKLNLYFAGGISNTMGEKEINEDNFITPSLYANYVSGYNLKCKGTYQLFSFMSVGLEYKYTSFSKWDGSKDSTLYTNSTSKINSLATVIKLHTKFKMEGFFNKAKLYAEFKPIFGQSTLKLSDQIFDIYSSGAKINIPTTSQTPIKGIETSLGVDYALSKQMGLMASFSYNQYKVESQFYSDKQIIYTSIDLGFYIRLTTTKHYF